ncbi:bublin coiled-coil protein isoform X2 [Opisthocomus hoazin]|uniref:bublin coiled-coil protein isoform X2 n=1 Tax=Opisthocomus hoazin TaxID=30419 RepID=UPI003F5335E3
MTFLIPSCPAGKSEWRKCDNGAAVTQYAAINSMLDQINSCLDHLEEKNDYLHACLKELLESNRQTRLEFQQQSEQQNMEADVQGSQPPV